MKEKFQKKDAKTPECKRCKKPIYRGDRRVHIGHDMWHDSCYESEQKERREKLASRLRTLSRRQCNIIQEIATREQAVKHFEQQRTRGKSISICPGCQKTVFLAERGLLFHRAYFHPQCFRCCQCDKLLQSNDFWSRDHEPWCRNCYQEAFKEEFHATRYDHDDPNFTPSAQLIFHTGDTMDAIFGWVRERKLLYCTVNITDHKNVTPHFWRVLGEEIELVPDPSLIDFDAFNEWKVPRKTRSLFTTESQLQEFADALTKDGPAMGMISYTYQKEEFGQIFDSLILFTWLPADSDRVDKILYGTCRGKLCDVYHFNYSILVETKEALTKKGILKSMRQKKNKR